MKDDRDATHFGFRSVAASEKAGLVGAVFSSVADRYDIMNDLMSLGIHRLWKRLTLMETGLRAGQRALDLAGGTGDLARGLADRVGSTGQVVLADINARMLERGRERLTDRGLAGSIAYVQANAEQLPFRSGSFDCVTIGFGLRNVTHIDRALAAMHDALAPGGCCLVLEFSRPVLPLLARLYDAYSFSVLPRLGQWVAGDAESYQYLVESIRRHPDQDTLRDMMASAGFERVRYSNFSGGIVALHKGYRT